ncbi:MAG: thioredoxin family protein [Firmicutes bacterium]|nr:thioredoxin family protein [Candidatus Fiminaster equi]
MKFRKLNVLILLSGSLLMGCGKSGDTPLLMNSDFVLYETISDDHLFYSPTLQEFDNLYNSNLNFIIMFSEEGCSACESFAPIIKEYIQDTKYLVVKIDGPKNPEIENKYKDILFKDSGVKYPALFVKENEDNFYRVDYSKYMQTKSAFSRHMESRYKTSKCGYFLGEIPRKTPIISNYTYVDFKANDTFKNKISNKILNSQNNVIISSNFDSSTMTVFEKDLSGEFTIARTTPISNDLDDETISKYL